MHEINVLPPTRRQSLRREVAMRSLVYFLTSLLYATGAVTMIAVLLLAILWGYQWQLVVRGQDAVTSTVQEYQGLREEIAENNLLLEYIQGLSANRFEWSAFLRQFVATIPPGVQIDSINGHSVIRDNTVNDLILTFSGQAAARGTLIIFADRLRLLNSVTSLDAPTSNLIRRENPQYRFTLQLDPTNIADEKNNGL